MKTLIRWLFDPKSSNDEAPKAPSGQKLAALLDEVISEWCKLRAVPAGRPTNNPVKMDLEYRVVLQGAHSGQLVLRAHKTLAAELAHASTGDPGARVEAEDAFRDFCSRFAGRLLRELFQNKLSEVRGHLPLASSPELWPAREPDSDCVVLVEYRPLEARLWLEPQLGFKNDVRT